MRSSRTSTIVIATLAVAFLAGAVVLTTRVPLEAVLGSRVRLPLFHGASTWVDMALFATMGLTALAFLVTRKLAVYSWEAGIRAVAAPLWVFNSGIGLYAALKTWDFTGSQQSPLGVAMQDPRLMAQFWLLLAVGILLALDMVLDELWHKSIADLGFTLLAAWLLGSVLLDPVKRSLHPDSPVLNSGWDVKGPFFGIVACLAVAAALAAWLAARSVYARLSAPAEELETPPAS